MRYRRIKELREDKDITQQTIASYLKISRTAYTNYENGIRNIPIEILSSIADYYNTSIDFLVDRTDAKAAYPKPMIKPPGA